MKKLSIFFTLVGAIILLSTNVKAQVIVEGSVSAVNAIDDFTSVTGLDLSSNGSLTTVASITVSNNYENAWDLKLEFTNDGMFKRTSATGDASTAAGVGTEIEITSFSLVEDATPGTLGAGLTAPSGTFILSDDAGSDFYTFDTGAIQTTSTVGYKMNVQCSWSANSENLQGTYQETITATLTAGDGV